MPINDASMLTGHKQIQLNFHYTSSISLSMPKTVTVPGIHIPSFRSASFSSRLLLVEVCVLLRMYVAVCIYLNKLPYLYEQTVIDVLPHTPDLTPFPVMETLER